MTEDLRTRLNQETARIEWKELQPHFARGATIHVSPDLDLIDVAMCFIDDDSATLKAWIDQEKVGHVSATQAETWTQGAATLWAVVIAPWVLVQPEKPSA